MRGLRVSTVVATDGAARAGRCARRTATVETPAFMPVGTPGRGQGADPGEVPSDRRRRSSWPTPTTSCCARARSSSSELGGPARFMAWPGPILTDSGGFQVFSLAERRKIDDDGVDLPLATSTARSGSSRPSAAIADPARARRRHHAWRSTSARLPGDRASRGARRSRGPCAGPALRERPRARETARRCSASSRAASSPSCARQSRGELVAIDFPGYAIGGLSVGEPQPSAMYGHPSRRAPLLPADRPRYLMGVGMPDDLSRRRRAASTCSTA